MYGKHAEAVRANMCYQPFINDEVYKYPDYVHMAIAEGGTRETITIACVYTISSMYRERGLYVETTKETVCLLAHSCTLCVPLPVCLQEWEGVSTTVCLSI